MTKWMKDWYLQSTTRDLIKDDGNYLPKFITEEELKRLKMPKRKKKNG